MTNKDITVWPKDVIPYAIQGTTYGFKIVRGVIGPILTETWDRMLVKPKAYIIQRLKEDIKTKVKGIPKAIVDAVAGCTGETPALCASGGRRKPRRKRKRRRKTRHRRRRKSRKTRRRRRKRRRRTRKR